MSMKPLQVNTKFVNHLQPKRSKFVTDVKLARDMHSTNSDHLYTYLRQCEAHANEVRLMRLEVPRSYCIGLVVLSFLPSNDPITSLNKAMAFISTLFASRYPPTNNQIRTSFNPRNQATIQDGKVIVHNIQGRQSHGYAGSGGRGKGHMARQCTKPKRLKNSNWFKEKMLLAQALESGVVLDEEYMTFLADNRDTVTTAIF
ncbi:hypothetical protein Tco_0398154 [Tanacetum coccineum]